MTPAPENPDWLDEVQTGRVSPEEAARLRLDLRRQPREAARLEEELALNAALDGLPPAPVPSNFASQVLDAIQLEERRSRREVWGGGWRILRWLRPVAATALLALALVGWWQFQRLERRDFAASVSAVSQTAAVPGVEVLQDFDAIQLLRTPAQPGDVELIAALATP